MARKYAELRDQMTPEARARVDARVQETLKELPVEPPPTLGTFLTLGLQCPVCQTFLKLVPAVVREPEAAVGLAMGLQAVMPEGGGCERCREMDGWTVSMSKGWEKGPWKLCLEPKRQPVKRTRRNKR